MSEHATALPYVGHFSGYCSLSRSRAREVQFFWLPWIAVEVEER